MGRVGKVKVAVTRLLMRSRSGDSMAFASAYRVTVD